MAHTKDELKSRLVTQFGVLRSICYPESPTVISRDVDTFSNRTRTCARTDGRKLTKVKLGHFQKTDTETNFVTILHEVTHAKDGSSFGKGCSAHSPAFWEEFQNNFDKIQNDEAHKSVVQSLFGGVLTDFDWERAKYRAVQGVSQVDKRSETINEREEKLAK
jgi:hypothetical protein